MLSKSFLIYLFILLFSLAGCGSDEPAVVDEPIADEPTQEQEPPAATEEPTQVPQPTLTPIPAGTNTPAPTVEAAVTATKQADFILSQPWLTNCRYGVAAGYYNEPIDWIEHFGAGRYLNFGIYSSPLPEGVEHLPMISIKQDKEGGNYLPTYTVSPPLTMDAGGLGSIIQANPRGMWIAGNEPDVASDSQGNTNPEVYARAYHDVYSFIKEIDPQAQVAIAALSMMTPGRLQYLDIVWDTYLKEFGEPMPVDVWNMHLYILSEIRQADGGHSDGKVALGTDPALAKKDLQGEAENECPKDDVYCRSEHDDVDIFIEQIVGLRNWMKEHGQQNKPLLLSEYSLLYPFVNYDDPVNPSECFLMDEFGECFTEQRVSSFLDEANHYLESAKDPDLGYPSDDNRLVQQWTWYSMWTDPENSGGSSNLLVDDYESHPLGSDSTLTQPGQTYRDWARSSERTVNLVAGNALDLEATAAGGTADVELEVGFYNNGSIGILDMFKVTFYKDEALTQEIGEVVISPVTTGIINGCSWGRPTESASVTWEGVAVGTHNFWAKIDSTNRINDETDEADNVTSGTVIVN